MENDPVSVDIDGQTKNLDVALCIICQLKTDESLVEKPTSYEKILNCVEEWASYGHLSYTEAWEKIRSFSAQELKEKNTTWHRSCYKDAVHTGMLKRAKERYERQLEGPNESRRKSHDFTPVESPQFTRSKTSPFNKDVCFFCDKPSAYRQPLHKVSTFAAGESLSAAVKLSGNEKLAVKLNTSIAADDAHSADIRYHLKCWLSNVTNVLRKPSSPLDSGSKLASEIAAKIEFLTMTEITLREGKIASMSELEAAFESILEGNNVDNPTVSRKSLKQLLLSEIPGIEFHRPKRVNESERVSIKITRDAAIQEAEDQRTDLDDEMKTLFDAASVLRKSIRKCNKWKFTGSFNDISDQNLPVELYSFFRWVIQGPNDVHSTKKSEDVHKRAMSLSQSTVSMCLSDRQVKYEKSDALIRSTVEMPQQLAVGLAVHQAVRSKELINMLHEFGMSVDYNRILRVEAQIESSVLNRVAQNDGIYLPPDIVIGRHVFFAVDNVDFAEDTPDGKHTFHGTAMAIYQRSDPTDKEPEVTVDTTDQRRSIKELPESVTKILECPPPPSKPVGPVHPQFGLFTEDELPIKVRLQDFAWLLGRSLTRAPTDNLQVIETEENQLENEPTKSTDVPVWSGYNSMISDVMPVTRVGAPPLVAAPAHEWQTLLTVLMQAQNIKAKVVGPTRKTVISLDMGLYQPAKKLQMSRQDLNHLILRPGELHIVMAQLRAIGAFIENSGLDLCWLESDLYGPATVKQIIGGDHVKRGETAHLITVQALFEIYQEDFFKQHPDLYAIVEQASKELDAACKDCSKKCLKTTHNKLVHTISSTQILEKMKSFDAEHTEIPLFMFVRHYMRMVLKMMSFIRAVRTGDWELHLEALELFTKYFFAHDMLNYARMIPVYLAEMQVLPDSDPEIYHEFQQGNWVVNKNDDVSFCGIGGDNALEHLNRSMKVSGGLVGITLNPTARTKYFLIAPELARLAEQAKQMAGTSSKTQTHHHNLSTAVRLRQEKNIDRLVNGILRFTNPFTEESADLYNLVTKVVTPENVKKDLSEQSTIGKELFNNFVKERIQSAEHSIWSPMKKRKLLTWKSTGKTLRVATQDKVIELKEDRSLFARMMVVCKSRPEIDIKEAVGLYEFSVVPRSMFAADGTMFHCSTKSALMDILEKLPDRSTASNMEQDDSVLTETADAPMKVSIVDGMAEVQAIEKPDWIKNCSHLADHFTAQIFEKYSHTNELRLIFDR